MIARALLCIPVVTIWLSVVMPCSASPQSAAANQSAPAEKGKPVTLEGVVDESGGKFVLANPDNVEPMAELHGRGFSDDNFARFVGLRVTVKGDLVEEGGRKRLYVRNLADIQRSDDQRKTGKE
jgi:hypothetical protein